MGETTKKHHLFSNLFDLATELMDFFDPERDYKDDDGMIAVEFFKTIKL